MRLIRPTFALVVVSLALTPGAAQASPKWFINGKLAETKHEPEITYGKIEWKNSELKTQTCQDFLAGNVWNESEKGLWNTVGYATWECKAALPCEVTNEAGVTKEGSFWSAEGPPTLVTEKARRTGNTSLPWTGELIEKEPEAGKKARFVLMHHMRLWFVVPLDKKLGGPGEGAGCEGLFGGAETPWEEQEGASEKAAGIELAPATVNGNKNGLSPSHGVFRGEKTEKTGVPETGRLENPVLGPAYFTGEFITTGATDFELLTAE